MEPTQNDPTVRADMKKSAFKASRLTSTTFVVTEFKDSYDEHPLIYVKICTQLETIVIIDTGCGGATDEPDVEVKSLRTFIETVAVEDNADRPLNDGGKMRYIVILSHCHYDHIRTFQSIVKEDTLDEDRIVGVEDFAHDSPILASNHNTSFISPENLPKHSLCDYLGISTPRYTPSPISHGTMITISEGGMQKSTGLKVLHTPGHTPDERAVWDDEEQMLYVGDTLYQWAPIMFPNEGSIKVWMRTVEDLLELVEANVGCRISCGHVTHGQPAREVLLDSKLFMMDVIEGREKVCERFEKRGEMFVHYVQEGHRYSLVCPERLVLELNKQ